MERIFLLQHISPGGHVEMGPTWPWRNRPCFCSIAQMEIESTDMDVTTENWTMAQLTSYVVTQMVAQKMNAFFFFKHYAQV